MQILKLITMAAAATLAVGTAHADVISLTSGDVGKSFTVNYDGHTSGPSINGLTASIEFTLTGVSGNNYSFNYSVTNTSSNPISTSRISGFGFNTNPNISGASSTGIFNTVGTGNAPNVGNVDVCFKAGGGSNNCAGGGGNGVNKGGNSSGTLTLNFGSAFSSIELSDFFVRYQSISGAGSVSSAVGTGTVQTGSSGGTPVPEPADLALFAIGVVGLMLGRRSAVRARRAA